MEVPLRLPQPVCSARSLLTIFRNELPDPEGSLYTQIIHEPTFHSFKKLPTEIRRMIWRLGLPRCRVINLSARYFKHPTATAPALCPLLSACRESRQEMLCQYIFIEHPIYHTHTITEDFGRGTKWTSVILAPKILFSPSRDRIVGNMIFDEDTESLIIDESFSGMKFMMWFLHKFGEKAAQQPSCFKGIEKLLFWNWDNRCSIAFIPRAESASIEEAWYWAMAMVLAG